MNTTIQSKLFNQIFRNFRSNTKAIDEITALLNVSRTSVYNRANGRVALSMEEFETLTTHFNISPLAIHGQQQGTVIFDYAPLKNTNGDQQQYLHKIIQDVFQVAQSTDGQIIYLSTDLPFFYYFIHEEIAWFKQYIFQHTHSTQLTSKLPKIDFNDITDQHRAAFKKLIQLYCAQVPSQEIWTSQALQSTVAEIKYFVEIGLFHRAKDAILLMEKLTDIADKLLLAVSENNKGRILDNQSQGQSINLYYNDFNRFNSTIIAQTDRFTGLYLTFDLPNYLYTTDQSLNDYTIQWVDRIIQKSFRLSGNADIAQLRYFNRLKQFLEREKRSIGEMVG